MKKTKAVSISLFTALLLSSNSLMAKSTISLLDANKLVANNQGKFISQKEHFKHLKDEKMKEINIHISKSVKADSLHKEKLDQLINLKNDAIALVEISFKGEKTKALEDYRKLIKTINNKEQKEKTKVLRQYADKEKIVEDDNNERILAFNVASANLKHELKKIDAMEKLKLTKRITKQETFNSIKLNDIGNIITYIDKNKTLNGVILTTDSLDTLKLLKYSLENGWSFGIEKRITDYLDNIAKNDEDIDYENFKYLINTKNLREIKDMIKSLSDYHNMNSYKNTTRGAN